MESKVKFLEVPRWLWLKWELYGCKSSYNILVNLIEEMIYSPHVEDSVFVSVQKFLDQDFNEAMIEYYFKEMDNKRFDFKEPHFAILSPRPKDDWFYGQGTDYMLDCIYRYPKTLGQFITYCLDAGIELEFKNTTL